MKYLFLLFVLFTQSCNSQNSNLPKVDKEKQQAIIDEHLTNCATKYNYNYAMDKWQECLDKGLEKDSTIAYLWQQKAMPLFKARKYEAGMVFLDKAVKYDEARWLDYRAFIKCIFAKTYKEAIVDFEKCKARVGNSYVMDHSYDFHIALSYLQLNDFKKAESIFKKDTDEQAKKHGEAHHLDLFYYGISLHEQQKFKEAITVFDRALKQYPQFSDVKYYKALAMYRNDESKEVTDALFKEAKADLEAGYTINEDQIYYEMYPYQIEKLKNR
ncbi:tetratricopeptide repeat protein [Flavobacterium gelidilacus]|jgi:tetratricopeptide (TPR) repeat protein|uniref:tetratricopeptide repeat protein n=1 Tax=Flavobacterium gelidilacus TaxID=206041 RepID=UPI00047DE208|nr:tetratricopeptide repeat protein [Flavobacterium gelidilacus]